MNGDQPPSSADRSDDTGDRSLPFEPPIETPPVKAPPQALRLNCPHCQNPIEVLAEAEDEILCPSCGSSFHVDNQQTRTWDKGKLPKLGKFELLNRLGFGAFGTVYKAYDSELKRSVALKLPRSGTIVDQEDEERFLREARSAAQLHHSGIVPIFEVGRSQQFLYIVSELVEGITLADALSAKRLSFRESAELIQQVAEALDYSHKQGVVHRDLKPSNIMLTADGTPRIMDFGLAKRETGEVTMTVEGQVLGTPAYMSPELAAGKAHEVDGRSDVYSLGVILYELLTGELPFRGNQRMLMHQVMHDEPRAPRSLNDRIPRDLETICLKCLEKEATSRYATAHDLAVDLARFLKGDLIHARRITKLGRIRRWTWKRRRAVGLISVLALVSVGLTVAAISISRSRDRSQAIQQAQAFFDALESNDRDGMHGLLTQAARENDSIRNMLDQGLISRASIKIEDAAISGEKAVVGYTIDPFGMNIPTTIHLKRESGVWRVDQFGEMQLTFFRSSMERQFRQMFGFGLGVFSTDGKSRAKPKDSASAIGEAPRFPRGVVKMPEWIGNDLPFNAEEYFRFSSPKENSESLYLDALFEFANDVEICFPESRREPRATAARVRQSWRSSVYIAFLDDPASVRNEQIDDLLREHETGLRKLQAAQERGPCVFQSDIDTAALIPHVSAALTASYLLPLKIHRELQSNEVEKALTSLGMQFRLAHDLRPRGDDTCQLVSKGIENRAFDSIVRYLLPHKKLTTVHCDRLIELISRSDGSLTVDPVLEAARHNHLMWRKLLYLLKHNQYDAQARGHALATSGVASITNVLIGEGMLSGFTANVALVRGESVESAKPESKAAQAYEPLKKLRDDIELLDNLLPKELAHMTAGNYEAEVAVLNGRYRQIEAAAKLPHPNRALMQKKLDEQWTLDNTWKSTRIIRLFKLNQSICEPLRQHELRRNAVLCLVAIANWRLRHNQDPASLAEAVVESGLATVPIDPYSGDALKMTVVDGHVVVYSVGPDGDDDDGRQEADSERREKVPEGDLVFRLESR